MRSPPEADAIHRHRTGLAPEIAILNGGVRPDLLDCPKWLALAPPAFALASPSPRPGGARAKAGGAVPLVEPELSPLSLSTARETLDDGNADAQVTTLGQRDPIDYPNRSAVDYLDHAQREIATVQEVRRFLRVKGKRGTLIYSRFWTIWGYQRCSNPGGHAMPRTARSCLGGYSYHVLNRGNARAIVFQKPYDSDALLRR